MADVRSWSMVARSEENMSGCWSYLEQMYCLTALERARGFDVRNGTCELDKKVGRIQSWREEYREIWQAGVGQHGARGGGSRRRTAYLSISSNLEAW